MSYIGLNFELCCKNVQNTVHGDPLFNIPQHKIWKGVYCFGLHTIVSPCEAFSLILMRSGCRMLITSLQIWSNTRLLTVSLRQALGVTGGRPLERFSLERRWLSDSSTLEEIEQLINGRLKMCELRAQCNVELFQITISLVCAIACVTVSTAQQKKYTMWMHLPCNKMNEQREHWYTISDLV